MLYALIVAGALCVLTASAWLFWQNRASETLLANLLTAGGVGVVGLLATVWFSLRAPETRDQRFVAEFVVETETLKPLSREEYPAAAPYAEPSGGAHRYVDIDPLLRPYLGKRGETFDDGALRTAYRDVLLAYVLDVLTLPYQTTWDVDIVSDRSTGVESMKFSPREPYPPRMLVRIEELVGPLSGADRFKAALFGRTEVALPPETVWTWKQDKQESGLTLANPFVTLTIGVENHFSGEGTGGLNELMGVSREETAGRFAWCSFSVQLHATFERLRSGHPSMPRYVRWVDSLFFRLRRFDLAPRLDKIQQMDLVRSALETAAKPR